MQTIDNFGKVYFDFGAIEALGEALARCEIARPLLVSDQGVAAAGILDKVRAALPAGVTAPVYDQTPENPTDAGVDGAFALYQDGDCDGLIAVGGGSVIDSCKGIAVLAGHPGPLRQYHGHPELITAAAAPIVAVPTTAGTGAEVTRGAGIHPDAQSRDAGVASDHIMPKVAICDPELTLSLPPRLTAGTGMDALSHCFEGLFSARVNPPVEAIALDGARRVARNVEAATADGNNRQARWELMMAALEGGMAISMGLGPVHSLGTVFGDAGLHHGALVALAMPPVIRFYDGVADDKMSRLGHALGLGGGASADKVAAEVERLNEALGIPATLKDLGYPGFDTGEAAALAESVWFNATAPKKPGVGDFAEIIGALAG